MWPRQWLENTFLVYRWSDLLRLAILAAIYTLLAKIMLIFFSANHVVSIFWPPSGVALAALLIGGIKYWPGVLVGAFAGNFLAGSTSEISLAIAIGNTLEAFTGSWILLHLSRFNKELAHARDYFWLALVAVICALVSAVIGNSALTWGGVLDKQLYAMNLLKWWQGDVLGIVLVTPFLLVWRHLPCGWFERHQILDTLVFVGLTFVFGQVIFLGWFGDSIGLIARGYWMFLFIVWGALRFGRHGTLLIIGMVATQSITGAALRVGYFGADIAGTQLNNFWCYILVLTFVGVTLCLTMYERAKAETRALRLTKLYRALSETNQSIIRLGRESELFPLVCRCAVDYGEMKMAWIGQLDASQERIVPVNAYGSGIEYLDDLTLYLSDAFLEGRGPSGTALRENHPVIIQDFLNDPMTRPWRERGAKVGWGSSGAFPIQRAGKPFAVLNVYHGLRGIFDEEIACLLKEMSSDISFALDNFDRETRRQAAEKMLYQNEAHFRLVTETAQVLIWMAGIDKQRVWFNKIWLDFTGRTLEQSVGYGWAECLHPDDLQDCIEYYDYHFDRRESYSMEYRLKRYDGEYRWILVNGAPYFDDQGQFQGYFGACLDITERKTAEARLILQSIALEAAANAIMIVCPSGVIEWVNPAFTQLTGYSKDEAIGKNTDQLFKCDIHHPETHKEVWSTIRKGQIWKGEIDYVRKDGSCYTEEQTITPVIDEQGIIRHYIAIKQDITSRKANEAELEQHQKHLEKLVEERTQESRSAREEAERLSHVKSIFLANMSHEIRSPMNAMMGFFYLLEKRPLDAEARQLVRKVTYAGNTLLAIINDILDFSKIESGHLEIEKVPFNLSDVLDQVAALMSVTAGEKNIELIINPSPLEGEQLIGDGLRLQQVLVNLTSNAIKFTEQGEVELSIKAVEALKDGQVKLRFAVRDTGIGISEEKQTEIFTAFTQADTTISRRFGGSGLGLAISRQLVTMMGGKLQVESQPQHGSTFWFELAYECNCKTGHMPLDLTHLELLVADDSMSSGAALVNTAKSLGWEAEAVTSGDVAYSQTLRRWESRKPYDVVLLDWKMPGLDGLATAQAIKQSLKAGKNKQNIPPIVIMVSAYSRDELLKQAGMDYVDSILSKPVTPSALYNAITEVFKKRTSDRASLQAPTLANHALHLAGVRILLVDDSEFNREIAQKILTLHGAVVNLAKNGQEAIDWLSGHPNGVDIVLMDVQMPGMDGYEATRHIRQDPRWGLLPIVALTAGAFTVEQDTARQVGMNDFVSKPFNVDHLIKVIQRFTCGRTETSEIDYQVATQPIDPTQLKKPDESGQGSLSIVGIDCQEGINRFGDKSAYFAYLGKFIENYANTGNEVARFIQLGDTNAASALVHKLKGVAGNLALKNTADLAHKIESLLATGSAINDATKSLQQAIDEACKSISCLINQFSGSDKGSGLTKAVDNNPGELIALLEQLFHTLDQDNPSAVESMLLQLQPKLPPAEFGLIQGQVAAFDFRSAEKSTKELILKYKLL